jgi:hypothetical protein
MSDRSADDYIELPLDTTETYPQVIGHASRGRGRRVTESETPLGHGGGTPISRKRTCWRS